MRILDKFISFVFSLVIIVLAMTVILVSVNAVNYAVVEGLLTNYVFNDLYKMTVILISVLFVLAGLKVTVFSSTLSSKGKKNIYVNTPNGKIQIAQETIEGIAKNVISSYSEVKDVKAAMTKAKKGINLYMGLLVYENTNITSIVTRIQDEVKKQIESTTGVQVYNVDVKVRNVVSKQTTTKKTVQTQQVKNADAVDNNTMTENKEETLVKENAVTSESNESVPEQYVAKQPTDEYSKDENGVLYRVEPYPNTDDVQKQ